MKYISLYYFINDNGNATYILDDDNTCYEESLADIYAYEEYQKVHMNMYFGYSKNTCKELKRFRDDYNRWCKEISTPLFTNRDGKKFRIQMKNYLTLNHAIFNIVNSFSTIPDLNSCMEPITKEEFLIHECECYNAGLMTMDKEYKEVTTQAYGYDFSSEYPNALAKTVLPKNAGEKAIFDALDYTKLQFGIYRVQITYTNPNFAKVFSFSPSHHYTSRQLRECYNNRNKFGLTFKLLPVTDQYDYNAYVYDGEFVKMSDIFGDWLKNMLLIKSQCSKDNQLCKLLITSVWGCFSETKKIRIPYGDDCGEYMDDDLYYNKGINKNSEYEFIDYSEISKHGGFYRLKVFLTSAVRVFMMSYAIKNEILDDIIRIHTDSFMLKKEKKFSLTLNKQVVPKPEDKSTGLIKFYNCQKYRHVCPHCEEEFQYKDFICHSC